MKKLSKNNKGFSLVELIVVVLIMAIIAVSLAPQVMKWVGNSRIATDRQTVDSAVATLQIALTDSKAYDEVKGEEDVQITVGATGVTGLDSYTDLEDAFEKIANPSDFKLKTDSASVTIHIKKGVVEKPTFTGVLASEDLDS